MSGRSVLLALDKERHLRFTINALSDLEQVLGMGLGDVLTARGGLGVTTIRAALWAGLKHEDAALTVAGTGEIMQGFLDNGGRFQALGEALREALVLGGFAAPTEAKAPEAAAPFDSGSGSTPTSP